MVSVGWQNAVNNILEDVLSNENIHPQVGAEWIKLCTSRGDWRCSNRLAGLIEQGEVGLKAMEAYIDAIVQSYFKSHLRQFIDKNRNILQKSTFAWGSAGFGLTAMHEYKPAARWHADWSERPDATPWMLLNAVEAFRALKRDSEAANASRTALAKSEKDFQPHHHTWLAFDEICEGNIEAAKQHLERAALESFNEHYRFLTTIFKCVVEIAETSQADSSQVFQKVKLLMKHARFTYHDYGAEPARRRAYRRCLKEIARYRKGSMAKLWFWSNWIKSYLSFIPGVKIEH
jgi:hypothetical protein